MQRFFRRFRGRATMAFVLNPCDRTLDLNDKDDRKLFENACEGLDQTDRFDGKAANAPRFLKLIGNQSQEFRLLDAFKIGTEWDMSQTAPRVPSAHADLFSSNVLDEDTAKRHVDLVWSDSTFGTDTPLCFGDISPSADDEFQRLRNQMRMRHAMAGKQVWKSLTSDFQVSLTNKKESWMRGGEINGLLLWCGFRKSVYPTTKISSAVHKDSLDVATMKDHGDDVKAFNEWFEDITLKIARDKGDDSYKKEYLRHLFRIYVTSSNEDFVQFIKTERRKWLTNKKPSNFDYEDLMELALAECINSKELKEWSPLKDNGSSNPEFLALSAEVKEIKSLVAKDGDKGKEGNKSKGRGRGIPEWRFINEEGLETIVKNGVTYRWCLVSCHPKPMWCPRENCLPKSEHRKLLAEGKIDKKEPKKKNDNNISKDFKMVLVALIGQEKFDALEKQCLN